MAVELRCPECRAKLRLPEAPEEGTEIECPKCGHVFAAEGVSGGRSRDEAEKPREKSAESGDDRPRKKKKNGGGGTATAEKAQPRKRRLKKRKNNPMLLVGVIVGGLMLLGFFLGAIIWFFTRQSASQEMMLYLPEDCDEVSGVNLGHLQKYPEFYKNCEQVFANNGFKKAADLFSKALGQETNDTIDYVVQGVGKAGGSGPTVEATVLRTKEKFDTGILSKLPGAKEYSADGVKYYTINDIPELGYPGLRVFAPTERIVVFCRGDMPEKIFKGMLSGNKDNPDGTPFKRSGQLGKQIVRGTAWKFMIYGRSVNRMPAPAIQQGSQGGGENDEDLLKKEIADLVSSAQGCGYKASVGSREVRAEFVVWYKDSDAATNMFKKWKEKDWVQDEEKEPPKFFKALASKSGGGKTAQAIIRDGLSFRRSGETFTIRTAMDVNLVKTGASSLVSGFTGTGVGPGGFGPPGGGGMQPPGGMPPPGGGGAPPGRPRRRRVQCGA